MSERNTTDLRTCDLLAAYEMGLLDDADRRRFEDHLDGCDDCLDELYSLAPVAAALTADPGSFAAAASTRRTWTHRLLGILESLSQPRVLAPVAAAAALALLLLLPAAPRWTNLATLEPLPYTRVNVRAGDDQGSRLFTAGMARYTRGEYGPAAEILLKAADDLEDADGDGLAMPATSPDQARLYAGVSLLLDGRTSAAKAPLQAAAGDPLPPISENARWYLAQACLLTDRPDSAGLLLKALADSPVYGPRAKHLLEEMTP